MPAASLDILKILLFVWFCNFFRPQIYVLIVIKLKMFRHKSNTTKILRKLTTLQFKIKSTTIFLLPPERNRQHRAHQKSHILPRADRNTISPNSNRWWEMRRSPWNNSNKPQRRDTLWCGVCSPSTDAGISIESQRPPVLYIAVFGGCFFSSFFYFKGTDYLLVIPWKLWWAWAWVCKIHALRPPGGRILVGRRWQWEGRRLGGLERWSFWSRTC